MFNTYTDDNCCWTIILSLSVLPMKFCPLYAVWHMLPQWLQKPLKVSSMKLTSCPGSYHFVFPRKHIVWCFVHFLKKNQKKKKTWFTNVIRVYLFLVKQLYNQFMFTIYIPLLQKSTLFYLTVTTFWSIFRSNYQSQMLDFFLHSLWLGIAYRNIHFCNN